MEIISHPQKYKDNQWTDLLKGNKTHPIKFIAEEGTILEVSLCFDECSYLDLIGPFEIRNFK